MTCQEQTRRPRAVTDQSPAPAREEGPGVLFPETTSWTCAPTCSGRRRRGPPNALDRSPAAGLWLRTGPQFPTVKPTLCDVSPRSPAARETSAHPAAERSPAAAGNRSGRVWEPTSRRPPAAGRRALPPCGWGPLAAGRSPRRLPGRPICPRGPSPPAARAASAWRPSPAQGPSEQGTPHCPLLGVATPPAGGAGRRPPSVRNFPLPNRRPRRLRQTAALANQSVREVVLEARPCPLVSAEPQGNAVAPGNRRPAEKGETRRRAQPRGSRGSTRRAAGPPQG